MEYLLEWMSKLGALSPVEVALEAEEDEFDGMESEERREALEQANCANQEDLEHGRSATIGQVYQVACSVDKEDARETEVGLWRKGVKLGVMNTILDIVPEAEISIIDIDHLKALGVAREEVRDCLDVVRGKVVVGQVELEVERLKGSCLTVR